MSTVDSAQIQVGSHATALNNLVVKTDGAGGATIEQGVIGGGSNRVVLTVDSAGKITSVAKGVTDGSNAAAGDVGEYISSSVAAGSAVALVTNTGKTVTSISLTAGDWDVSGFVAIISTNASTSITNEYAGVSTTANTFTNDYTCINHAAYVGGLNSRAASLPVPDTRISIASTTTVYLVAQAAFTVSTCGAYGTISARRVR